VVQEAALGGCPCEVQVVSERRPGTVRLIDDRWLVTADPDQ
jgi:hypothetical protein